jgi:hypothetical protein
VRSDICNGQALRTLPFCSHDAFPSFLGMLHRAVMFAMAARVRTMRLFYFGQR